MSAIIAANTHFHSIMVLIWGGVTDEQCNRLSAAQQETVVSEQAGIQIVTTTFSLTDEVIASFHEAIELVGKNGLVIVSRVHRNAIDAHFGVGALPQVVCSISDRATKLVSSTKFSH